jgi:hypothetical protein
LVNDQLIRDIVTAMYEREKISRSELLGHLIKLAVSGRTRERRGALLGLATLINGEELDAVEKEWIWDALFLDPFAVSPKGPQETARAALEVLHELSAKPGNESAPARGRLCQWKDRTEGEVQKQAAEYCSASATSPAGPKPPQSP